jgi:hypothetical protein
MHKAARVARLAEHLDRIVSTDRGAKDGDETAG